MIISTKYPANCNFGQMKTQINWITCDRDIWQSRADEDRPSVSSFKPINTSWIKVSSLAFQSQQHYISNVTGSWEFFSREGAWGRTGRLPVSSDDMNVLG